MRGGFYTREASRSAREAGDAQAEVNRLRRALEVVAQWAELPADLRLQVTEELGVAAPRETIAEAVERLAKRAQKALGAKVYAPLPIGNPELGEDTFTARHMYDFADATDDLRSAAQPGEGVV